MGVFCASKRTFRNRKLYGDFEAGFYAYTHGTNVDPELQGYAWRDGYETARLEQLAREQASIREWEAFENGY